MSIFVELFVEVNVVTKKKQYVTIKGTKDGLTLHLDDNCSYDDLLRELEEKLTVSEKIEPDSPLVSVHLKVGNRYLTPEQEEELRTLIRRTKNFVVSSIESNVLTKEEALEWKRKTEIVSVSKIVRSGQVLHVQGDLLLIGDVNPGGTVIAGGNIFILGALRGIAHAGYYGNKEAVIAASVMKPTQLRISDVMNRAPDYKTDEGNEMECAYIDEHNQIVVDRLQLLMHLRPNLTRLERRM
ncbi:septum site-determining protein MinC [Saccharococcus caldoxylosilyticus]|jgi:septum site-determining protein MinC|uniref:Probable septum site-determining protein MinC n=1 Tax=Parageobacillus caldoxylosilyticus NBRC 107762 TaxID=1220594 RepID=A0A023DB95_9BACL|nr:septum site-determining protein MinC [Parageobacillus caldoxylosilyticus]OQP05065.1 septum site-determining protein MinC [Geobacillus sp. 44B]QNU36290.1 septum site-determining protein MinC [Geobacillus sp. 44B]QXJ39362.1 Septum site-determining protein MinC [Parageobacillus caldoxylosilyticus]BDG36950.1 putative septum site-determining protein MinC [Parageobacillus caldoxylosilyticus]BDG40739.1 putative septum site-determining protein MinC [Parageobacillus caldoxylosilyticus]